MPLYLRRLAYLFRGRRVVRALLVESFLLVLAGAAVGLPLSFVLSQVPWSGPWSGPMYGVMAYVVASQTAEVGIRMALGASGARIKWEVLRRSLMLVAAGVVVGGAASLGLAPALRTFLVGVSPFDPMTFAAAAMLLVMVGLAAGLVPAHRASRVDPVHALRQQ